MVILKNTVFYTKMKKVEYLHEFCKRKDLKL